MKKVEAKKKGLTVYLDEGLREKMVAVGEKEDRGLSWVVARAIKEFLERRK